MIDRSDIGANKKQLQTLHVLPNDTRTHNRWKLNNMHLDRHQHAINALRIDSSNYAPPLICTRKSAAINYTDSVADSTFRLLIILYYHYQQ